MIGWCATYFVVYTIGFTTNSLPIVLKVPEVIHIDELRVEASNPFDCMSLQIGEL